MKRLLFIITVLCLLLTGCQQTPAEETTLPPVQTSAPSVETTAPTQATTEPTEVSTEPATEATTEPTVETTQPPTEHVHSYSETVVQPSCTEGGYTVYSCTCGDSYTGNETGALGHNETQTVVEPTADAQGYTLYTCQRCGISYKDNYTDASVQAPASFFDDAAFIGDSVTMALRNYNTSYGVLGGTTFLCQGSYSVAHAVNNTMYLSYQGQDMTPQSALAACGAKKVFILLGMNDIALHGVDASLANWATLISNIRSVNPDITIYIQSGTPIYTAGQIGGLNNERMDDYNGRLQTFASENGCYYIDIATAMKDSTNGLAEKYCSDKYVHLTYAACDLWVGILKAYVGA